MALVPTRAVNVAATADGQLRGTALCGQDVVCDAGCYRKMPLNLKLLAWTILGLHHPQAISGICLRRTDAALKKGDGHAHDSYLLCDFVLALERSVRQFGGQHCVPSLSGCAA